MTALSASLFNALNPVGTPVKYWPSLRRGEGHTSRTTTPAWELGSGTAVVSVEGYAGGIALTHIVVLPPEQDPHPDRSTP